MLRYLAAFGCGMLIATAFAGALTLWFLGGLWLACTTRSPERSVPSPAGHSQAAVVRSASFMSLPTYQVYVVGPGEVPPEGRPVLEVKDASDLRLRWEDETHLTVEFSEGRPYYPGPHSTGAVQVSWKLICKSR